MLSFMIFTASVRNILDTPSYKTFPHQIHLSFGSLVAERETCGQFFFPMKAVFGYTEGNDDFRKDPRYSSCNDHGITSRLAHQCLNTC
jgi:hypothetical protein